VRGAQTRRHRNSFHCSHTSAETPMSVIGHVMCMRKSWCLHVTVEVADLDLTLRGKSRHRVNLEALDVLSKI
jgi:hypothetical protein